MTTIATICARGGSKGVPRKNIRPLLGRPLIVHTIEQALAAPEIERVFVSTDDREILDVAVRAGAEAPYVRPADMAKSDSPKVPVIRHLVEHVVSTGVDVTRIVDLDPTSPLRDVEDISKALALLDDDTDVVITGYLADKNPYFNMVERGEDGYYRLVKGGDNPVFRRQDAPDVYAMNASIYIWHRRTLGDSLWGGRIRLHAMPRERSVDVDSELDFKIVELLMREKHERSGN